MYSAKKIGGVRLYKLARQGKEIERKPVEIEVHDIKLLSFKGDLLKIRCRASSGTFIRTLAADIGKKLKTGAYVEELKRTAIGDFTLKDAVDIDDNAARRIIPLTTVLVSGTFDGVHEGHRNYFQQARALGHRLICIVGRDSMTKKIKGKQPKRSEKERVKAVKQCAEIDRVYLGIEGDDAAVFDFTASLEPDIIALGYDQYAYVNGLAAEMEKRGREVEVKKLRPFEPHRFKSSVIDKYPQKS